jgi:protein gp37
MSNNNFWDKGIQLVDGCTKVSPGCMNCWSESMTDRFKRVPEVLTDGRFNGKVIFNLHLLEKAAKVKKPHVYAIWNDLYHIGVSQYEVMRSLIKMEKAPQHIFLIVTKRPERAIDVIGGQSGAGLLHQLPFHIWHIVTCEDQEQADKRIPQLLQIPGKRGIIMEPMLEEIQLGNTCISEKGCCEHMTCSTSCLPYVPGIHQVIVGPENGHGKRPFDPQWAESVKAQCEAAGVPFYRKDKSEGQLAWRP